MIDRSRGARAAQSRLMTVGMRLWQRRLIIIAGLLVTLGAGLSAQAQDEIEAGASQNYFYIEPSYDGTRIVLFGSIDREKLSGQPFDVAVTIRGPATPVTLWKKDRRAGLWINSERLTFEGVPNFYAVLSTRPIAEIAPPNERKAYELGLDVLSLPVEGEGGANPGNAVPKEFQTALIRLKTEAGLFAQKSSDAIDFVGPRLFRSRIDLPAAAGAGLYRAKFYVFQNGKLLGETSAQIRIKKIGIEAKLSSAAVNYPWIYGLLAVAIAAGIGGGASLIFRRS
jgi:uncharacterized protein (TIGR02186 family)